MINWPLEFNGVPTYWKWRKKVWSNVMAQTF